MATIPRMVVVSVVAAIIVGLAVAVPAVFLPHPSSSANQSLNPHVDTVLWFTDRTSVPAVTVSGNVHVHITGAWSSSSGTWFTIGYSVPFYPPTCWPRCGNASTAGVINVTQDECTTWPGGGTSYYDGDANITIYVDFASEPGASDVVWLDMAASVTPSTACA
jgi:hypothetical protein